MSLTKFQSSVRDSEGNSVEGATVVVTNNAGGGLADIYSDELGTTPIAGSALISGADGYFSFYAATGDYDITPSKTGYTFRAWTDVSIGRVTAGVATPGNTLQSARIMWNVNRYNSGTHAWTTPTDTELDRITDVYGCNVVQFSFEDESGGTAGPPTDAQVETLLASIESHNLTAILQVLQLDVAADVTTFLDRWKNDDRVLGFDIKAAGLQALSSAPSLSTTKPVIILMTVTGGPITNLSPDDLSFPPFLAFNFEVEELYSAAINGVTGYCGVVNPAGPGDLLASVFITVRYGKWAGVPAIPGIPMFTDYNVSGGVFNTDFIPSAEKLAATFSILGTSPVGGIIYQSWDMYKTITLPLGGYGGVKRGIYGASDSDPKLVGFKSLIADSLRISSFFGGERSTASTYETAQHKWGDNLLVNPELYPTIGQTERPELWDLTKTGSGTLYLHHNLLTQNAVTGVTSSDITTQYKLEQTIELPPWMSNAFLNRGLTARFVGWQEVMTAGATQYAHVYVNILDGNKSSIALSYLAEIPPENGVAIASVPLPQNAVYVKFTLFIQNTRLYINNLSLSFGIPTEGLQTGLRNRFVQSGGISKHVQNPITGEFPSVMLGPIPMFLNAGSSQISVPANNEVYTRIDFDSPRLDSIGGIAVQQESLQGNIAVSATISIISGPGQDKLFCCADSFDPAARFVTVRVLNTDTVTGAVVVVHVLAVSIPLQYGNIV